MLLVPNLLGCPPGLVGEQRSPEGETPTSLQVSRSCHYGNGVRFLTFLCLLSPEMLAIVFNYFSIIELHFTF